MSKILKIDEAIVISNGKTKIIKYIFNDDKIVRVNANTDEIITENVSKLYTDLISLYSVNDDKTIDKNKTKEKDSPQKNPPRDSNKRLEILASGQGAGLGVFLGCLLRITIIGPIIAGFCSFSFLNDISDKSYLLIEDPREINFRKGFYASATFGLIVAIECCSQWKRDMISVLKDQPTKQSQNRHQCFKTWVWIELILEIIYIITTFSIHLNTTTHIKKGSSSYYYHIK